MPWEYRGITGAGDQPGLVGSTEGICLVLGGARCIWDDISKFWELMGLEFTNDKQAEPPWTTIAINDISMHYKPKVEHIVSMHARTPGPSLLIRLENACHQSRPMTHTQRLIPGDPCPPFYEWNMQGYVGGTSAGFAAAIGMALGCTKIVLAGVPLDGDGHYFDPPFTKLAQFDTRTQDIQWGAFKNYFGDRVHSMSGKTKKILGEVTIEWLQM